MKKLEVSEKIASAQKLLICFELAPLLGLLVAGLLFWLNPFCAGVKGDQMGCGIGGVFICAGIVIFTLLLALIGIISCSIIIRRQKTTLAKITHSYYEPGRFSVTLVLSLLLLFFAIFMAILMPLFGAFFKMEGWLPIFVVAVSGILSLCISMYVTYSLRT